MNYFNLFSNKTGGRVLAFFLCLYPVFTVTIDHWASGGYISILIASFFYCKSEVKKLSEREKIFLLILTAYFLSTIISNTINGWTKASINWFEADLRFICSIPMYLYFRKYPLSNRVLLNSVPLGAMVLGIQAGWAITETQDPRNLDFILGRYGYIIFGDYSVLLCGFSAIYLLSGKCNGWYRYLVSAGGVLSLISAVLSHSRNAWLSIIIMFSVVTLFAVFHFKIFKENSQKLIITLIISFVLCGTASFFYSDFIINRVMAIQENIVEYVEIKDISDPKNKMTILASSVGFRFEQWRMSLKLIPEKFIFGYGVGNIGVEINKQVRKGNASNAVYLEGAEQGASVHVHNGFLQAFVDKGVIGFILLLTVLIFPFWLYFIKREKTDYLCYLMLHVTCFACFSLTEVPFIRNNFTSIFFIYYLSFLAMHVYCMEQRDESP
jgi:O-antigen ligase